MSDAHQMNQTSGTYQRQFFGTENKNETKSVFLMNENSMNYIERTEVLNSQFMETSSIESVHQDKVPIQGGINISNADVDTKITEFCHLFEPNARFRFCVIFDLESCLKTLNSYVIQDFLFLEYEGSGSEVSA